MSTVQFTITNLTCGACVKLSTMALLKINGVTEASVDLATGKAEISATRDIPWHEIHDALKKVGKESVILH